MEIDTRFGAYWDMQAVSQANILHRLDDSPAKSWGLAWLVDRLGKLTAGRVWARDYQHIERKLKEVDPNLCIRWEFNHPDSTEEHPIYGMPAIDRFVPELGYYWTICYWSHRFGEGQALRQVLIEGDMQRPDYLKNKKLAVELAKEYQAKRRIEMAGEAIEQLTLKRAQEFIAVEHALQTGEKINSYGTDAAMLNRMYENTKRMRAMGVPELPGENMAINPGMKPGDYFRFRQ